MPLLVLPSTLGNRVAASALSASSSSSVMMGIMALISQALLVPVKTQRSKMSWMHVELHEGTDVEIVGGGPGPALAGIGIDDEVEEVVAVDTKVGPPVSE